MLEINVKFETKLNQPPTTNPTYELDQTDIIFFKYTNPSGFADILNATITKQDGNRYYIKSLCQSDIKTWIDRESIIAIHDKSQNPSNQGVLYLGDLRCWSGFIIKLDSSTKIIFKN